MFVSRCDLLQVLMARMTPEFFKANIDQLVDHIASMLADQYSQVFIPSILQKVEQINLNNNTRFDIQQQK